MNIKKIVIDNSKEAAVKTNKWDPDVAELISTAMESSTPYTLLKEIFLIAPKGTEYPAISKCKYPHHRIIDGKCVLDAKGVMAAYVRAKQQDVYEGQVKEHIDKHRRELGMIDAENKLNEAISDVDNMFNMLREAVSIESTKSINGNIFDAMMEVSVQAADSGTPVATDNQQQVVEPAQQPTIPVKDVNPAEDTSMNNPIEGPDTRDQDNLDGNQRKEMYQTFADTLTRVNNKNVFGTIFDQDVFKSEYKIVPYEMRYFYRLQNPVSVEVGDFKFIPFGADLLEAQDKYDLGKKMFVFATYNDKPVFFNMLDKTIWANDDKVNDTFDGFIDSMIQSNGEFSVPEDNQEPNVDANVEYEQNPDDQNAQSDDSVIASNNAAQEPVDLTQSNAPATVNTGLEETPAPNPADNMAPVDLTQQNASVEYDSILDLMSESTAFPNDELNRRNDLRQRERERRRYGEKMF